MTTLETLLRKQRWDEARKKLKGYKFEGIYSENTNLIFSGEDIPDDILEELFSNSPWITGWSFGDILHDECLNWSVSYLERFLGVLLKTTSKEPILNPEWCIRRIAKKFTPNLIRSLSRVSSLDDLMSVANGRVGILWKRVELLLRASLEEVTDPLIKPLQELPLLAKMIEIEVPKLFVWLVLKLWPEQARIPDNGEYGRLPLHWAACANNNETGGGRYIQFLQQNIMEEQSLIDMLMKVYPEGASVVDKKKGSYPLELLLDQDYYTNWQHCGSEWTKRNVMQLARQNPENLVRICPINHLMPFMTASCIQSQDRFFAQNNYPYQRRDIQYHKLNMTFALLMENPNAILSGITSTDREAWLTDKLDRAQQHIQLIEEENKQLKRKLQQQRQNNPSSSSSLQLNVVATGTGTAVTTTTAVSSSSSSFQIYTNIGETDLPPRKRKRSVEDRTYDEVWYPLSDDDDDEDDDDDDDDDDDA